MGLNQLQLTNLKAAATNAAKSWQDTGIPTEFTLAQWAFESGWGNHQPGNNCFGIKDYVGSWGRQLLKCTEYFTPAELTEFLKVPGRTAVLGVAVQPQALRQQYKCEDWFAAFPTLADCFKKRSALFFKAPYYGFTRQYQLDGDLIGFIHGISQYYSTSENYASMILNVISMPEVESAAKWAKGQLNFPKV